MVMKILFVHSQDLCLGLREQLTDDLICSFQLILFLFFIPVCSMREFFN